MCTQWWIQDLSLNLIAEAIGIIVTVLVINSIISARGRRRWEPVRQLVYSKIFHATGELIRMIVPIPIRKVSHLIYYFGPFHSYSIVQTPDVDIVARTLTGLYDNASFDPSDLVGSLDEIEDKLNALLDKNLPSVEPQVVLLTLDLHDRISRFIDMQESPTPTLEKFDQVVALCSVLESARQLRHWLLPKSTATKTTEQLMEEMQKLESDISISPRNPAA